MKTSIKRLTVCAAMLAVAVGAGAREPYEPQRLNRKEAGFNCPVCDSPCINKMAMQQKLRQHRIQNKDGQPFRREGRSGAYNERWQENRRNISQQPRPQKPGRFDIDGDGELSHPERAARRAYRDAMERQREARLNVRPDPQPPVE